MNTTSSTFTRERYLDIAKGIGIWSIVLLHFEVGFFPSWLNSFISMYMISVFYVVAGIIMAIKQSERSSKQFFIYRLKQLGIPYLWWSGIIIAFDLLLWVLHYYDGLFIAREVYKTFVLFGIGTLWFLPALFLGETAWYYMKGKHPLLILSFFLTIGAYRALFPIIFGEHNEMIYQLAEKPFHTIERAIQAVFCVALGYYFYTVLGTWLKKANTRTLMVWAIVLWVTTYFTVCHLHSIMGEVNNYLGPYLAPMIAPLALLFSAKVLENVRCMRVFEYWGVNSLSLMLIHYSFVLVLCYIIDKYLLGYESYYGARTLAYFVITIPILYWATRMINSKAKFLLGK